MVEVFLFIDPTPCTKELIRIFPHYLSEGGWVQYRRGKNMSCGVFTPCSVNFRPPLLYLYYLAQ